MNAEQMRTVKECVRASLAAEITFPQIVERLAAIGVERYHADYSRQEITYYLPDGDSLVVPAPHEAHATGAHFSAAAVEASAASTPTLNLLPRRWRRAAWDTSCKSRAGVPSTSDAMEIATWSSFRPRQ